MGMVEGSVIGPLGPGIASRCSSRTSPSRTPAPSRTPYPSEGITPRPTLPRRELGHKSTDMLEDRYAHLHDRTEEGVTEVVEFRANIVKDKALREKMEAVR